MIDNLHLIDIIKDGITNLTNNDKINISYIIDVNERTQSLYIYKRIISSKSLSILRISTHLPSLRKMIRSNRPRPSTEENANVSIDFYKPVKTTSSKGKRVTKKNEFDNYIGVPASIPEVIPFSMTSYEYFYRNLEESDEMVLWHCIAAWLCCTDPNKSFHDPFVTDEIKKAKKEYKVADVHIFGDKIEIDNERKKINTENISNNESMKITKRELKQMINEAVVNVLNEEERFTSESSRTVKAIHTYKIPFVWKTKVEVDEIVDKDGRLNGDSFIDINNALLEIFDLPMVQTILKRHHICLEDKDFTKMWDSYVASN